MQERFAFKEVQLQAKVADARALLADEQERREALQAALAAEQAQRGAAEGVAAAERGRAQAIVAGANGKDEEARQRLEAELQTLRQQVCFPASTSGPRQATSACPVRACEGSSCTPPSELPVDEACQ